MKPLKMIEPGIKVPKRLPGRPSLDATDSLREIYLQVALETFLAHGYAGSSLEQIARNAKAGKTTFYRQFGSKEELFRLVARRAISKVRERLQSSLDTTGEPEQVLRQIIDRLYTALTDPAYVEVMRMVIAEVPRFPELGETVLAQDHFMFEPVENYFIRMAKEGKLAIPDPHAAVMQLAGLAAGGPRFYFKPVRTDKVSRERWVEAILKFVLDAWEPRTTRRRKTP